MQLHGLTEDTAFQLLRKNAMSHRMTIGEMARRLLDAQQLLNNQKQKERIELLNKNSEQDRLINILLSVGLIGFLFFVFFLRKINNDLQNKNSQIELQKEALQASEAG